jgi:hypothetical protein
LFKTETPINCMKAAAVCTWHRTTVCCYCYLTQYFHLLDADISYVLMKLQECQTMSCMKFEVLT